jgi:hypothetical protein
MSKNNLTLFLTIVLIASIHAGKSFANIKLNASPQTTNNLLEQQIKGYSEGKENANQPEKPTTNSPTITPNNQSKELDKNTKDNRLESNYEGTEFFNVYGYKFKISDFIVFALTFFLAIFTFFLALIAPWQYRAMILSQRAFVFAKEFYAIIVPSSPGLVDNWRITAVLENSGETETRYLTNNINWKEFPLDGLPPDYEFPYLVNDKPKYGFIGPNSTIHSSYIEIPVTILDKVGWGQLRLYIWGWVEYNDVFNKRKRRRTEYCYEISYQKGLMAFFSHSEYNNTDEECYHKPSPYTKPNLTITQKVHIPPLESR